MKSHTYQMSVSEPIKKTLIALEQKNYDTFAAGLSPNVTQIVHGMKVDEKNNTVVGRNAVKALWIDFAVKFDSIKYVVEMPVGSSDKFAFRVDTTMTKDGQSGTFRAAFFATSTKGLITSLDNYIDSQQLSDVLGRLVPAPSLPTVIATGLVSA